MKNQKGKNNSNYRHGLSNGPEQNAYASMFKRCYNKKVHNYIRYGGRGIEVCKRWHDPRGFCKFLEDMGPRPSTKHSLGRINNDGNYEPDNCRWEIDEQQYANRSDNHLITFNGQTFPAFQWAKITEIPGNVIRPRILKYGWTPERALTTPVPKRKKQCSP